MLASIHVMQVLQTMSAASTEPQTPLSQESCWSVLGKIGKVYSVEASRKPMRMLDVRAGESSCQAGDDADLCDAQPTVPMVTAKG